MKNLKIIALLLTIFACTSLIAQQNIDATIEHDGETREYRLYIPASYSSGMELPLVINMHGWGSNSFEQSVYTGFNNVADSANILVVYPQGLVGTAIWGATDTSWEAYFGTGHDDLGFINKLIDQIYTDYQIDLSRVYATGMSNGGFMSYRLACELSNRIAAIASVTGAMAFSQITACDPQRPVPVMEIHGTSDLTVPYTGIPLFTPSIQTAVDYWVEFNECGEVTTTDVPDINLTDGSTVSKDYYSCNEDTEVIFYTVLNGGHSWPGAFPIPTLGFTNQDIAATSVIWNFFNRHQHPNPDMGTLLSDKKLSYQLKSVDLFPNPFSNQLTIDFLNDDVQSLRLVDVLGNELHRAKRNRGVQQLQFSTSYLKTGIYFLEFNTTSGSFVRKVVKD